MKRKHPIFNIFNSYKLIWVLLFIIVTISLITVLVPIFAIQPFKPQTNILLEISYYLRTWSMAITLTTLITALILQYSLWYKTQHWLGKVLIIFMAVPLLTSSWFAKQNHFEWMFEPLPSANYEKVEQANFIAEADMVLAIELNGEAVAYPVKQLAYHHIVQDIVGGTPIVATY